MFVSCNPFPGVFHITDAMGVSLSLVEGEDSALLFDAGYGLEDVAGYVRTLTEKPVELILSHGHHDHMLGARWFDHSLMDSADREEFMLRTAQLQRQKVQKQAADLQKQAKELYDGFKTESEDVKDQFGLLVLQLKKIRQSRRKQNLKKQSPGK